MLFWLANVQYVANLAVLVTQFIIFALVIYFKVSVNREICRNEKQIIANQVSTKVKEKLLKNKKAFYCTIIVLLTIFLSYLPANIISVMLSFMKDSIAFKVKLTMYHLITFFPVLNSLFNPLIYAFRGSLSEG